MKIIKATYGGVDCTFAIQKRIKNNSLFVVVNNEIVGDPSHGVLKYLYVKWERDGIVNDGQWKEGDICVLGERNMKKLGIFYSNNNKKETQATIIKSLDSIEKASKGKADIMTCMWEPQQKNPFTEHIAWTKYYTHLNQLLQIMQLLYTARTVAEYESVSFLEHDVLYPEDYFDYDDIRPGTVVCNMNYIGIKEDGFQKLIRNDQPFHQMTMRFDEAIIHCESILSNALITNDGLIEPSVPRVNRFTKYPSVHVNHGHHFTSHFSIYSKETKESHDYWGNISEYKHLFQS